MLPQSQKIDAVLVKTINDRLHELTIALGIIYDSLTMINNGRLYQIIPLAGQLRALLCEGRNNTALLFDIAEKLNVKLPIFAMPSADLDLLPEETRKIPDLCMNSGLLPITIMQEFEIQEQSEFKEIIEKNIIYAKETYKTLGDMIKFYAENAGGAHYDPTIRPRDFTFLEFFKLKVGEQESLSNMLCQVGDTTYQLGFNILSSISDFFVGFTLFIPEQTIDSFVSIVRFEYPNTPMLIELGIQTDSHLVFRIADIVGKTVEFISSKPIKLGETSFIAFGFKFNPNFTATMNLSVKEMFDDTYEIPYLFEFRNEIKTYKQKLNQNVSEHGLCFGFGQFVADNAYSEPVKVIELMSFLTADRDQTFILLRKEDSGESDEHNNIGFTFDPATRLIKESEMKKYKVEG